MSHVMKRYLDIAAILALALLVSACGNRSLGSKIDDQVIGGRVARAVAQAHPDLVKPTSHIVVTSYNGVVLLAGQIPRPELKPLAENAARSVQGIHRLHNELQIMPPTTGLVRSNDALLTSNIKAQMIADSSVASTRIKVVTENGTVFLLGIVTHQQASDAMAVVQSAAGVQKIVKLFQYLD